MPKAPSTSESELEITAQLWAQETAAAIAEQARTGRNGEENPGRPATFENVGALTRMLTALVYGCYRGQAAQLAGVDPRTLRRWIEQGNDEPDSVYGRIADAVQTAEAMMEESAVRRIRKAGEDPRNWPAEMTLLERRAPERWGRRKEEGSGPSIAVYVGGLKDTEVIVGTVQRQSLPAASEGHGDF